MTIKLGMFTMPFHHPARDYTTILEEDQDAIVLADQLGFSEVFVGVHFSSWSGRITPPPLFLATLPRRARVGPPAARALPRPRPRPGPGAAHAAMFDHLVRGHFIMGIGPGGLASD